MWFFIFMFAINGFCLFLNDAMASTGYAIVNPFTNATISFPAQPSPVTTLANLTSSTATNSTGGTGVTIWDTANYGWNATLWGFNLLTGGFIFQALAALIPASGATLALYVVVQGVIGIFLIITGIHFFRAIF